MPSSSSSWSCRFTASPRTSGVAVFPPGIRPSGRPPAVLAISLGISSPVFSAILSQRGMSRITSVRTKPGISSTVSFCRMMSHLSPTLSWG